MDFVPGSTLDVYPSSFRKHLGFVNPGVPKLEKSVLLVRLLPEDVTLMVTETLQGSKENSLRYDSTLFFNFVL